ncbi:hypothetical protein GCM10009616_23190 [Microlunatus lacustris]
MGSCRWCDAPFDELRERWCGAPFDELRERYSADAKDRASVERSNQGNTLFVPWLRRRRRVGAIRATERSEVSQTP